MKKLILFLALAAGGTCLAIQPVAIFQSGFEPSEGYEANASLGKSEAWRGEGAVSAEDAAAGEQSLEITGEVKLACPPVGKSVAYVDFHVKPAADDSEEPYTVIEADGARLAFLKDGNSGVLYACDGESESVPVSSARELDAAGRAADWTRVTLRLDYGAGTYDVYVDGAPAAADLRLDPKERPASPKTFAIRRSEAGGIGLDDFRLTATNPLYSDRDDDMLPDAYEEAHGLDLNLDDRRADRNQNSLADLAEFLAGFRPGQREQAPAPETAQAGGRVIYVDAAEGDDGFDGRQCYRVAGSGPKASVKAAQAVAESGDTVVVQEGTYYEGNLNLTGTNIRYKFTGYVKLR